MTTPPACTRRRTTPPGRRRASTAATRCPGAGPSRRGATTAWPSTSARWSSTERRAGRRSSGRSCSTPTSTASRTTGTSPGSRGRGARTSWWTRRSFPSTAPSRTWTTPSAPPLPGQEVNPGPLYRLPWSVVFNMALAASVLGSAQGFIEIWIAETATRSVPGGLRLADDPLSQRRLAEATWTVDAAATKLRADAVDPLGDGGGRPRPDHGGASPDALEHQPRLRAGR